MIVLGRENKKAHFSYFFLKNMFCPATPLNAQAESKKVVKFRVVKTPLFLGFFFKKHEHFVVSLCAILFLNYLLKQWKTGFYMQQSIWISKIIVILETYNKEKCFKPYFLMKNNDRKHESPLNRGCKRCEENV